MPVSLVRKKSCESKSIRSSIMAEYLEYDELRELHKKSIDCGLNNDPLVFLGIDRGFVASLPHKAEPASKLMLALSKMNDTSVILKRQVVPLERWLRNASYACCLLYTSDAADE